MRYLQHIEGDTIKTYVNPTPFKLSIDVKNDLNYVQLGNTIKDLMKMLSKVRLLVNYYRSLTGRLIPNVQIVKRKNKFTLCYIHDNLEFELCEPYTLSDVCISRDDYEYLRYIAPNFNCSLPNIFE